MLISADDHLDIHAMPPDVWSSGLPKEWRERMTVQVLVVDGGMIMLGEEPGRGA
jgi:hypothetical protein